MVGSYLIAYAMLLITGARLGQTHGYRRMFIAGMGIFTAASLGAGLAPTPIALIVARVIQGLGAALMFPQALTGIQLNFAGPARTWAIGYYAIAAAAGAVAGQLFGGLLISANLFGSDWRPIFLINVPIGVAAIAAAARFLPGDTHRTIRRLDLIGVGALSVAVLLLVLPLTLGRSAGWPVWTWLCLAASLPVLGVFLARQRHLAATGGAPLINLHVLVRRSVSFALLALALATGTYYALLFTLAQYLQQGLGDNPLVSGLMLVPWVAAFGVAGQLVRLLPARAAGLMPTAGCLLLTGAYLAISITLFTGNHDQALLIVLLGGGGLGLGLQFNALIAHLTNAVPAHYAPDISGVTTTVMQIGGAIAIAGFGTLYVSLGNLHSATHNYAITAAALTATAAVATIVAHIATRPNAASPSP